ncbi:hypothetical protein [Bacillus phage TBA3]|uniref:Uncharacterized protein n=2 Tax=Salasvirus TaxID=186846 RepID=A0A6M9Z6I0_9CAUD|nr:hypothetical protein H3023_gp01 [Bacillus phage Gxv1]AYJ76454.1 hypothetical protein BSP4_001 [Bacillus phage BSP4]AYJ76478.1 hypothetical protein BSP2_001 [Bacillus phage BSP2]QQO90033.1 hypothetical protein BSTP4_003 [Bacillus phage BSTP4]UKM96378.1 hypothetical protein [Bacillus phage TBA3]QKN88704.1 hypothetical protein [Bacillus phage Gxv1]
MSYLVTIFSINDTGVVRRYETTARSRTDAASVLIKYKAPRGYKFDRFELSREKTIFDI